MSWFSRWRNVFRPERLSNEIDDELRYHLEQSVDDLVASGMSEVDAWRTARRRLGNYSLQKERTRDMDVSAWLDSVRADLIYGLRQWKASPGFAAVAILSLALGIGANTAIFQLVNAIRLRPLPVKNPHELVALDFEKPDTRPGEWSTWAAVASDDEWKQLQAQQQAFSGMFAWAPGRFNLSTGGEPNFVNSIYVSGDFFKMLGVSTVIGRPLSREDDSESCSPAAVISDAWWQRSFAGSPDVLSRSISLNGLSIPIVGVTPGSFFGVAVGQRFDVAVPLCMDALLSSDHAGRLKSPTAYWLSVFGRLKPGWTLDRAIAYLHAVSPSIMQATLPASYTPDVAKSYLAERMTAVNASNGLSRLRTDYGGPLWLLMAATGLIVLIACANLANLLLARASVREPEIAVRLSLGASRARLIRQLLVESLLLALAGTLAGSLLAHIMSRGLIAFISPAGDPLYIDVNSGLNVLLYSAALAVLTSILFGLAPAIRASYLSPAEAMRGSGRSVTSGRERFSLRRALVVAQVALSLVLLFGALLFVRTLHNLLVTDPGFETEGLMVAVLDLGKTPYPPERRLQIYNDLRERLAAVPGAVQVARAAYTPISGQGWNNMVAADNAVADNSGNLANLNSVSPGFFRTMNTRIIAGRDFDEHDRAGSPKVTIVNQAFARKLFGAKSPIGHSFRAAADAGQAEPSYQIIGLAENAKYRDMRENFVPEAYFDIDQDEHPGDQTAFLIRISGEPGRFIASAKAVIAAVNPLIGAEFRPLSQQIHDSLLRETLMAMLSSGFGFLAVALAALGLYGVIAYMIARRANEIGVRIALGADRARVVRLVLGEAVLLLAAGTAAGIGFAWWAGKSASALLFGLKPYDAVSLLGAVFVLGAIGLLASYLPARRAGGLDPSEALRNA